MRVPQRNRRLKSKFKLSTTTTPAHQNTRLFFLKRFVEMTFKSLTDPPPENMSMNGSNVKWTDLNI